MKRDEILDAYPLSKLQSGIHFHAEMEDEEILYHDVFTLRIRSPWDQNAFTQAIQQLVKQHPVLRTWFDFTSFNQPLQLVHRDGVVRFSYHEPINALKTGSNNNDLEKAFVHQVEQQIRQLEHDSFNLSEPSQIRFTVMRRDAGEFQLLVDAHHIILDGWSMATLLTQLFGFYLANLGIQSLPKSVPAKTSFKEFIKLEQQALADPEESQFWSRKLDRLNYHPVDFGIKGNTSEISVKRLSLSDFSLELAAIARQEQVSLKDLLLSIHLRVCAFILGSEDGTSAIVTNGRPEVSGGDQVAGLFLNMLPVSVPLRDESWSDLIQRVKSEHQSLIRHRRFPFSEMVKEAGHPVSDICFNYVHFHVYRAVQGIDEFQIVEGDIVEKTNFPLTFTFHSGLSGELDVMLQYDKLRASDETAERILAYMHRAVTQLCQDRSQPYLHNSLLSQTESEELLSLNRKQNFPVTESLHRIFEKQVMQAPEAIALTYEQQELSYQALNQRANKLARCLLAEGITHGDLVGVYVDRSLDVVVSILAALKVGAAYVPIDPAAPVTRVEYILQDAQLTGLISQYSLKDKLTSVNICKIWVERISVDAHEEIANQADINLDHSDLTEVEVAADDRAYVIYTSGSTGKPKGVEVTHANVARLFTGASQHLQFDANDVWTVFHSYAFDFSVWEIWGALLHGGRLVMVPYWVTRSADDFNQLLSDTGVTVLNQTPGAFYQLIEAQQSNPLNLSLRYVIFGGEKLNLEALAPWVAKHGDNSPALINMYGITETTVHVTYRQILKSDIESAEGSSLIGKPLPDLGMLVLGPHGEINPAGVVGELYISGAGLAKGYLNRAELTEERFVHFTFQDGQQERLYRTGDLVRLRVNRIPKSSEPESVETKSTEFEYIGRTDTQVKIRGFRIELGEIESELVRCESVQKAHVLVVQQGQNPTLVAYFVPEAGFSGAMDSLNADIKKQLYAVLPDYMVPKQIISVEKFALTVNGKLDVKALPSPDLETLSVAYQAPTSATEKALVGIWAEVLNKAEDSISNRSNFFDLGGDSLTAMQVVTAIRRQLKREVTVKVFFEAADLASFALILDKQDAAETLPEITSTDAEDVEYEEGTL